MKSSDPASLQNLNDIVLPATVSWWPLAPGWNFLLGLLLIALAWSMYRLLRHRINNRYRRAALHELQLLSDRIRSREESDVSLRQIPILLKRAALSAYPRKQVASLTGRDWFDFLNSTLSRPSFSESTVGTLNEIAYSCGKLNAVDSQASEALLNASRHWLKHHQPIASAGDGRET